MPRFTPEDVRLENWTDALFVPDHPGARAAKAALEAHFLAEWNDDIDATMATMDPVAPFQRIPALGVDITGVDPVRAFYLERFAQWPGPAMTRFDRVTIGPDVVLVEGRLAISDGSSVAALSGPAVIVVDVRDGLILGETVHAARGP
jgi:hypothetical protein